MGRRTLFIIIFVVGVLLLAVVGIMFVLQQDQPQATETAVTVEDGVVVTEGTPLPETAVDGAAPPVTSSGIEVLPEDLVQVVVSLQTVPRGWVMTEAELTTDWRLASEVDSNVITDIDEALGKIARIDIFQGQTLTKDDLVDDPRFVGEETFGPSSLIPTGFVAQAVPMSRLSGVAYGLAEGDTIDIMISFAFSQIDPEFQTLLQNSANFVIETVDEETGETTTTILSIDPYGRFEELPTGDTVHVQPNGTSSPIIVSMILQNAKVIQVGKWQPVPPVVAPTPTPEASLLEEGDLAGEGAPTPTPVPAELPTPTPSPPDVLLVALAPQQQLLLKYAVEVGADIDFALRGINDSQLYSINNVDLNYLIERFNIEVPPDYDFTVEYPSSGKSAAPEPTQAPPPQDVPEGG
jgi:Flp pilus assembly protein CpaB